MEPEPRFAGSSDPYRDLAYLYDPEHDLITDDIELYRDLATLAGEDVLDLGCGTGRVMSGLLLAGLRVTGVDISDTMLSVANGKLRDHGVKGTLRRTDMRELPFENDFNLAICCLDSFGHLITVEDQQACLAGAYRALRESGLVAIDVLNATPEVLAARDGALAVQADFTLGTGQAVKHFVSWRVDYERQRIAVDHIYDAVNQEGAIRRRQGSYVLRYFTRFELEQLLTGAGFAVRNVYGDYHRSEYTASAQRLLVVAEKQSQ